MHLYKNCSLEQVSRFHTDKPPVYILWMKTVQN